MQVQGVCCDCQSVVDVELSHSGRMGLSAIGWDDEDIDREFGSGINYVCSDHLAFGERCSGVGMCPQVVFEKFENLADSGLTSAANLV